EERTGKVGTGEKYFCRGIPSKSGVGKELIEGAGSKILGKTVSLPFRCIKLEIPSRFCPFSIRLTRFSRGISPSHSIALSKKYSNNSGFRQIAPDSAVTI